MLRCRDIAHEADALVAGELGWRRRVALRIHLLLCPPCEVFLRQYLRMVELLRQQGNNASESEVAAVMTALQQQLKR